MPRGTPLMMSVSTTEQEYHALTIHVDVTGVEPGIVWTLTLQNLLEILNDPVRRLGVKLEVDWGSGDQAGLEEVSNEDLVANLQLEESLDNISGGDKIVFRLFGRRYVPLVHATTRGRRQVRLTGITNAGRSVEKRVVFDGYFFAREWQASPPIAEITCLDVASRYSEILLNWNEEPGSTKTRLEWLIEVLREYSIPIGEIDLGPFGDTPLTNGVTIAETPIFEAIAEVLSPCGCFTGIVHGAYHAVRYTGEEIPVRTITADDIAAGSFRTSPPDLATPTAVSTTSNTLTYTEPTGDRTEISIHQVLANYAPKRAAVKLSTQTGAETAMDPASSASEQPILRIITKRTYRGDMAIRTEVVRQEPSAPLAAARQLVRTSGDPLLDSATVEPLGAGHGLAAVYQYEDGSWRTIAEERLQTVSRTIHQKVLDSENIVVRELEQKFRFHFTRKPVGRVSSDGDVEFNGTADIPITESGEGLVYPYETIGRISRSGDSVTQPDEETVTTFSRDAYGYLESVDAVTTFFDVGAERGSNRSGTYVYGFESRQFKGESQERFGTGRTIESELYADDDHRPAVHFLTRINTIIGAAAQGSGHHTETAGPDEVRGPRPRPERLEPIEVEQEFRARTKDQLLYDQEGERVEHLHNNYCQNDSELLHFSEHTLRLLRAHDVAFEMLLDWLLHKLQWIQLDLSELQIDHKLLIWAIYRNLQPGAFSQSVNAIWFPAEVA